ncbi:MAG TPA: hypothetical protein VFB58_08990 [Chloroflexota bacterium]|nr:hypothetical protein [Chloroflexota bacterium]
MKTLLKILALIIFGPLILGLIFVVGIVAIVALPILWEEAVARVVGPRQYQEPPQA